MSTDVLDRELLVGFGSSSISGAIVEDQARVVYVHLFGDLVPGWKLRNPLPLRVERNPDGGVLASDDIFNVYGAGKSWEAALRDYKVALVEFFEITSEGQDEHSKRLLEHLKAYLGRG